MAKRSTGHSEQVRAALLAAATRQFLRDGYEVTTVRSIANEAGMTTGSLYHFFSSKEGIFEQLVRDVFEVTMQMSRQATVEEACPLVAIGYELAIQLEACVYDLRLAKLYYAAHTSLPISELICTLAEQSYSAVLKHEATHEKSYMFVLVAKSLMFGLSQECLVYGRLSMPEKLVLIARALWHFVPSRYETPELVANRISDLVSANQKDLKLLFSELGKGSAEPSD